ncbi:hypothetical protein K435DRAFT_843908 [Dendrothele bispora CBS 962.96]|uniref:cystathionine gamma-lyase n=1 Tax=Dendrothele bispora (strain CBS 962.96) TaxID=1314807 RepID=A0A4S8L5A7_DENBC|nr:hypothetical protein K435DRAFT_843908 [Dendrothele bispora CBS 962.96]
MTIGQDLHLADHRDSHSTFKQVNGTNGHASNGAVPNTNGHASKKQDGFGTRAIHVGSEASSETGAVIPPISLSTTYKQNGVGNHKGFEYSRSGNPNRNALEQTLASIEAGGAEAIAFASGSSTTANIIQSLGPNAHVISVNDVYGGTFRYMTRVAPTTQGLQTTFLDLQDLSEPSSPSSPSTEALLSSITPSTKLVWVETPTNPTLRMIDIARLSSILTAHSQQTGLPRPLILVDNTFASPSTPPLSSVPTSSYTLSPNTSTVTPTSSWVLSSSLPDIPYPLLSSPKKAA